MSGTYTRQPLSFDLLSPADFERVVLWLARREGFEDVAPIGVAGNDRGRDLVGRRNGMLVVFQCKRVDRFGPAEAEAAVRKALAPEAGPPAGELILVVSKDVSVDAGDRAREAAGGVPCTFWAGTDLDEKVKRHTEVLDEFFRLLDNPSLWTVPLPPNPYFAGREEVLAELHRRLAASGGRAALSQVISGLGGIGKTQTAAEYCHRHRSAYRHVLWLDADTTTALTEGFGRLARQLGLVAETETDPERMRTAVRGWLDGREDWLLVFDNADEPAVLKPFFPTGGRGRVLVTSRRSHFPGLGLGHPLDLAVMTPAESLDFLRKRLEALDEAAATELAQELGHLPLALEQAAAYIAANGVSVASYLEAFRKRRLELLERHGPDEGGYRATVGTTWAVSIERVRAERPAAAEVLTVAAFLAPDGIPEELFAEGAEELGLTLEGEEREELGNELALGELLAPLVRYSLIRRQTEERTFGVHRLVQEAVRAALGEEGRQVWLERLTAGLNSLFPFVSSGPDNWPRCRRLVPHVQVLAPDLARLELSAAGRLLAQAGSFLWVQGRYREARPLQEAAVEVCVRVLGDDHPHTLSALNNLAETLWSLGDLDGARDLHQQNLEARRRVLGDEHPDTLLSGNNLAVTLQNLGDFHGARDLHKQNLEGYFRLLGDEHPDTLSARNNLAETLRSFGDLDGARGLHEQNLEVYGRVLGAEHPNTLSARNNLAGTLWALGDLNGARDLFEQNLKARQRVLGDEHPHTLVSKHNLASTLVDLGETAAARSLLIEAVAGARRVLGDEHPDTRLYAKNLAAVEAKMAGG